MANSGFKKELGLFDSSMLVAGSMIGSGIFIVSAEMSRQIGSPGWILLAWIFTGILTLMAALSYGELSAMYPKAGGQYVYLTEAYGKGTGFVFGLITFFIIQSGVIAAVAIAFARFAGVLFPVFSEQYNVFSLGSFNLTGSKLLAITMIWLLSLNNILGLKSGKIVQDVFTITKILALFLLIVLGFYFGMNSEVFQLNLSSFWETTSVQITEKGILKETLSGSALIPAIGITMVGALFSYDAWNTITYTAGEVKDAQKNIPKSLLTGTGLVVLLYCLVNLVYFMLLPSQGSVAGTDALSRGLAFAENDVVGVAAAEVILGNPAMIVMSALVMVSTFGCNNGLILSGARLYYAMAKDKLFFKVATQLNRNHVPGKAIIIQAVWASVLCLSGTFVSLLNYSTFASLLFYVITVFGIFVLRKIKPEVPRPYKTIFYPYLPALYVIFAGSIAAILLIYKWETSRFAISIIGIGYLAFTLINRRNNSA
ncbi:MAG: amino acid permease [Flavobacteriales bacterium]|nr:amino acid permease [Flavobacteriales bacterium]